MVSCCDYGFCFSDTKATADDLEQYYMNSNAYSGVVLLKPIGMNFTVVRKNTLMSS